MDKLPISVFIIAKDEEDRIPLSIKSVISWVDEVIVIDSGSSDDTVKVSENLGAKVLFRKWQGYGPQKVYGESICTNDWILNIDADEEISDSLKNEIIDIYKDGFKFNAYKLKIKMVMRFASKPGIFAPMHNRVRLYNKNFAGFKDSTVHDSVVVKDGEKIGQLKGDVNHRSFRSYKHAIEKINRYSTMQAEDMIKRGKIPSPFRILLEPLFAFLKGYFLKRYIFLGMDGFIEACIYTFARVIRLSKTRELYKQNIFNKHHSSGLE